MSDSAFHLYGGEAMYGQCGSYYVTVFALLLTTSLPTIFSNSSPCPIFTQQPRMIYRFAHLADSSHVTDIRCRFSCCRLQPTNEDVKQWVPVTQTLRLQTHSYVVCALHAIGPLYSHIVSQRSKADFPSATLHQRILCPWQEPEILQHASPI